MIDSPAQPSPARIPALDGLRGIAILMVMTHHLVSFKASGWGYYLYRFGYLGWAGVDLFFVLSGFLITGILLEIRERGGSLKNFYFRRFLRIFPLYYATLVIILACHLAAPQKTDSYLDEAGGHLGWWWGYASNVFLTLRNNWVGGVLNHFWTLAIEEQFYLVWPAVVLLVPRRGVIVLSMMLIAVAVLARVWCFEHRLIPGVYIFTLCRMDGLCAGAWLAAVAGEPGGLQKSMRAIVSGGVVAVAGLVYLLSKNSLQLSLMSAPTVIPSPTLFAVCFTVWVAWVLWRPGGWGARFLCFAPLRWMGWISYGLYILHPLLRPLIDSIAGYLSPANASYDQRTLILFSTAFTISIAAAVFSWFSFERPILRLKRHFADRPSLKQKSSAPALSWPGRS